MPYNLDDSTQLIRKRKNVEQPLFLSKTFAMLSECPSNIACWNSDGTSFYVIDQKALSEKMIPQFFKHNNFSSFVRQLNFYGFHKVKSNNNYPLSKEEDTRILQFKHPLFQRDRPELLNDIRRAAPCVTQTPVAQDYELLKCQISELSSQVEFLTNTVNELKSALKRTNRGNNDDNNLPTSKIPKLSSRWDTLDDETIDMLLSLDRNIDENELHQPIGYHHPNNGNNFNNNNNTTTIATTTTTTATTTTPTITISPTTSILNTTSTSSTISLPTTTTTTTMTPLRNTTTSTTNTTRTSNNTINMNNNSNYPDYQNYHQNCNQIIVERRGAPYSHNVFKTGNIPTLIPHGHGISDVTFTHTSYPEFNKISNIHPIETLKTVTPLNHANAILGGFLTEFYSTLANTNVNKSNSSFSQGSNSPSTLNQLSAYYQSNTNSLNYSCENLYNKNSEIESDRISPTPSSSSFSSTLSSPSTTTTTSPKSKLSTNLSSNVSTYSTNSRNAVYSD